MTLTKNGCEITDYHGDPFCSTHQCGPLPALQCKNKGKGCPHCDPSRPDYFGNKTTVPETKSEVNHA